MILEIATVDIQPGTNADFEAALAQAQNVLRQSEGYLSHEFQHCLEHDNRYVFLIRWTTLEAHTEGFRGSDLFKQWRALIGPFFATPPVVEHFSVV